MCDPEMEKGHATALIPGCDGTTVTLNISIGGEPLQKWIEKYGKAQKELKRLKEEKLDQSRPSNVALKDYERITASLRSRAIAHEDGKYKHVNDCIGCYAADLLGRKPRPDDVHS